MGTVAKIFEGLHIIEKPPVPPELRGMPVDILDSMEATINKGAQNVAENAAYQADNFTQSSGTYYQGAA